MCGVSWVVVIVLIQKRAGKRRLFLIKKTRTE